jgi:hypothetical protein
LPDEPDNRALPARTEEPPLPVLAADARPIEPYEGPSLPAAIAAAAGGFLLGVATFVLIRVLRRPRRRAAVVRRRARASERIDVAATRSFLGDVHQHKER